MSITEESEVFSLKIDERVKRCLISEKINTVGDILAFREKPTDFLKIPNIGNKAIIDLYVLFRDSGCSIGYYAFLYFLISPSIRPDYVDVLHSFLNGESIKDLAKRHKLSGTRISQIVMLMIRRFRYRELIDDRVYSDCVGTKSAMKNKDFIFPAIFEHLKTIQAKDTFKWKQ